MGGKLPLLLCELQAWGLPQSLLTLVSVLPPTGGENIKSINQQSGAHVELQRNPPPSTDPSLRIFTIRGLPPQIEVARHLIDEKVGVRTRALLPARESRGFLLSVRGTCFPPEPHTSWASGSSCDARAAAPSPCAEGQGHGAGTRARPRRAGCPWPPLLGPSRGPAG